MDANNRLYRNLCLASSWLFLLGSSLIAVMTFVSGGMNHRAIVATVWIGSWSLIAASALPEIFIDLTMTRPTILHGRYTAQHVWANWLQTAFFIAGAALNGFAYKRFWDRESEDTGLETYEEGASGFFIDKDYWIEPVDLLLYGGILLSVSAGVTVFSAGCCCCTANKGNTITQTANALFLSTSITYAFASRDLCGDCFGGFFLLYGANIALLVSGLLWVIADCSKETDVQHEGTSTEFVVAQSEYVPASNIAVQGKAEKSDVLDISMNYEA